MASKHRKAGEEFSHFLPQLRLWIIISVINFSLRSYSLHWWFPSNTLAVLHASDKCVPMETDLSRHCHHWPVKWNPALPERNQLVTWLISHQYNSVTFDNQVAFKVRTSARCRCQTRARRRSFWSLCPSASLFPLCLCLSFVSLSLLWFVVYKGSAHLSLATPASWNEAAFRGEKVFYIIWSRWPGNDSESSENSQ